MSSLKELLVFIRWCMWLLSREVGKSLQTPHVFCSSDTDLIQKILEQLRPESNRPCPLEELHLGRMNNLLFTPWAISKVVAWWLECNKLHRVDVLRVCVQNHGSSEIQKCGHHVHQYLPASTVLDRSVNPITDEDVCIIVAWNSANETFDLEGFGPLVPSHFG